jgi:hypothetical protein
MTLSNIRAGKATVEIGADSSQLGRDFKVAKSRFADFGNSLRGLTASFAAIFSGAAITGGIFGAAKSFANTGSQLDDLSIRSGASAEALSELSLAARLSDVSMEALGKGFRGMQQMMIAASQGGKKQTQLLSDLNLDFKKLSKLSPEKQFETFAEAISQIKDPAKRTVMAMDVFGKAGYELIPLLMEGRKGLAAFKDEAHKLGISMSNEDAASAAIFGDALDKLRMTFTAVYNKIGAALAPMFTRLSNIISSVTGTVARWLDTNRGIVAIIGPIIATLGSAGAAAVGFGLAFKVVAFAIGPAVIATLVAIKTAFIAAFAFMASIAAPVLAAGAAIAGITATMYGLGITWTDVAKGIASAWSSAMSFLGSTFSPVGNAIASFVSQVVDGFAWMYAGMKQYFGAIGKALSEGNLEGAGAVAIAGLKRAFIGGFNAIYAYYLGFIEGFSNTWDSWTYGLATVFSDAWYGMVLIFDEVTSAMSQGWDWFTSILQSGWLSTIGFIKKAWNKLKSLFGSDVDADAENAKIDEATRAAKETNNREYEALRKQRADDLDTRRNQIFQDSSQVGKNLQAEQQRRRKTREDESAAAMNAANEEYDEALRNYQNSLKAVDDFEPKFETRKEKFGFDPDEMTSELESSTKDASDKVQSKGTFNAFAVPGLADDTVSKNTTEMVRLTAQVLSTLQKMDGLRFS